MPSTPARLVVVHEETGKVYGTFRSLGRAENFGGLRFGPNGWHVQPIITVDRFGAVEGESDGT